VLKRAMHASADPLPTITSPLTPSHNHLSSHSFPQSPLLSLLPTITSPLTPPHNHLSSHSFPPRTTQTDRSVPRNSQPARSASLSIYIYHNIIICFFFLPRNSQPARSASFRVSSAHKFSKSAP
jgi:hypothetical protein